MKTDDYRIGLVHPKSGLSVNQLADIIHRLQGLAKLIEGDGRIKLYVHSYDKKITDTPSIPKEITNLGYRHRVEVKVLNLHQESWRGGPVDVMCVDLVQRYACDEVWVCPHNELLMSCRTRPAQLWRHAQTLKDAAKFKLIPPTVSLPEPH